MKLDDMLAEFCLPAMHQESMAAYLHRLAENDARTALGETRREHAELLLAIARLGANRAALDADIAGLTRAKLADLVVFLPVFFRDFWTRVRPDELALMCRSFEVPQVPSPSPEPGPDTVRFMKRRFLELDTAEQEKILEFCLRLEHGLQWRAEMRPLIQQRRS